MTKFRVLVTGSRDWPDMHEHFIWADLTMLLKDPDIRVLTVVWGKNPNGADAMVERWCNAWEPLAGYLGKDVVPEPHPAAWNVFGKRAGHLRNEEMVERGADLCLAYPLGISPGTRGCMALASTAEIPIWNRTADLAIEDFVPA